MLKKEFIFIMICLAITTVLQGQVFLSDLEYAPDLGYTIKSTTDGEAVWLLDDSGAAIDTFYLINDTLYLNDMGVSLSSLIGGSSGTDDQQITDLFVDNISGDITLSLEDGGSATTNLVAVIQEFSPPAGQVVTELSVSGTELRLHTQNPIDIFSANLSVIQDGFEANTDDQQLSIDGLNLTLESGGGVTLPQDGFEPNTDNQQLSVEADQLVLEDGGSISLNLLQDGFEANTDDQAIMLLNNQLVLEDGGSPIDISYLDREYELESIPDKTESMNSNQFQITTVLCSIKMVPAQT